MTAKEQMLKVIQALPEDADFEQAMERLYLVYKVQRGLAEADAGKMLSHEEVCRQVAEWLK